jgi:hypothetical protein
MLKPKLSQIFKNEKGVSLILALILLAVGFLIIVPLLVFLGTSLTTSSVYENKTEQLYAADAGIQDAVWQVRSDTISTFQTPDFPEDFSPYKYYDSNKSPNDQYQWEYTLSDLNNKTVDVKIQNVWIPKDIPVPSEDEARSIIEDQKLVVTGSVDYTEFGVLADDGVTRISKYKIKIIYDPDPGDNLKIEKLGIWIPRGFAYFTDSSHQSSLETDFGIDALPPVDWAGNKAVIWSFENTPFLDYIDDALEGNPPLTLEVTLYFKPLNQEQYTDIPLAVSWIETSGVNGIPYSWDANTHVYYFESTCETTTVTSFISKAESRQLASTISGDYFAVGASLLSDNNHDRSRETWNYPTVTVDSSNIPANADISNVFLYWSSWKNEASKTKLNDICNTNTITNNWTRSGSSPYTNTSWDNTVNYYRGHYAGTTDSQRDLVLKNSLDLGAVTSGLATVTWDQRINSLLPLLSFTDDASNITTNWSRSGSNPPVDTSWSNSSPAGNFQGHSNTGAAEANKYLTLTNPIDLSMWAAATLSWNQFVSALPPITKLNDDGTNITTNWSRSGSNPPVDTSWSNSSPAGNFQGHSNTGIPEVNKYLTLQNSLDLSPFSSASISWNQSIIPLSAILVPPLNPEQCNDFSNWNYGTAWILNSGTFRGGGVNSGKDLTLKNSLNLSTYGATGTVAISIDTPVLGPNPAPTNISPYNPDTCSSNTLVNWAAGSAWSRGGSNPSYYYCARTNSGSSTQRRITSNSVDLSSYGTNGSITVNWQQAVTGSGSFDSAWGLDFGYNINNTGWISSTAFRGDIGGTFVNATPIIIPYSSTVTSFSIRFEVIGTNNTSKYSSVDNVNISVTPTYTPSDGLDFSYSTNGGTNWTTNQVFRGTGATTTTWTLSNINLPTNFLVRFSLIGLNSNWKYCTIDNIRVNVTPNYSSSDGLDYAFSSDGGTNWSATIQAFRGPNNPTNPTGSISIPSQYLNNNFKVRFYLAGMTDTGKYCNLDNILITGTPTYSNSDGLDFALSSDGGATYTKYTAFRGGNPANPFSFNLPINYLNSSFKLQFYLVGFDGSDEYCHIDNIKIETPAYSKYDGLDFSFSNDGGFTWSDPIQAFRGDIGSSLVNFKYIIPDEYLDPDFKMKFSVVGMTGTNEQCIIDNIKIIARDPPTGIEFRINGHQVYLDSSGDPQEGAEALRATRLQAFDNLANGTNPWGYSYSCYVDVTALVREFTNKAPDPDINYPGYGTYSVNYNAYDNDDNRVKMGDTTDPLGGEIAYAGWSLIFVYTSEDTLGHQLYLDDTFFNSGQDSGGKNVDFDNDGNPGGTIRGFYVPDPKRNSNGTLAESNAAKITCFVGEGDSWYEDDYIAIKRADDTLTTILWDGTTVGGNSQADPTNVWNSNSVGLNAEGVDIDTFSVPWGDPVDQGVLRPGDTSVKFDLVTHTDIWNMVYMIFSFRSHTSTGPAMIYKIQ